MTATATETRTINTVRWDEKRMQISYEEETDLGEKKCFSINWPDKPMSGFTDAFHALAKSAVELAEGPKEWSEGFTVRSVKFHSKDGVLGLQISGFRTLTLHNSPLNISTPVFYESNANDSNHGTFSKETGEKARSLIREVNRYLDGWREKAPESGNLFEGQSDGDE